jgi:hypothetical protein
MTKDVDHLPLETSVAIFVAVAIAGIRRDDRRSILTMVFFSLQELLLHTLPQATRLFTVPRPTWRTGNEPNRKRIAVHG